MQILVFAAFLRCWCLRYFILFYYFQYRFRAGAHESYCREFLSHIVERVPTTRFCAVLINFSKSTRAPKNSPSKKTCSTGGTFMRTKKAIFSSSSPSEKMLHFAVVSPHAYAFR